MSGPYQGTTNPAVQSALFGDPPPQQTGLFGLTAKEWQGAGMAAQVGGTLVGAVGSYYSVIAQRDALKQQALSLEFERTMASLNARQFEEDANLELEAAQQEIGALGLRSAAEKASATVDAAGRGVSVGVGSAAEVQASLELAKRVDALTIRRNGIRRANQLRRAGLDQRTRGSLAGVSAANLRATARSASPELAGLTSTLSGAGTSAQMYGDYGRRYGYGGR